MHVCMYMWACRTRVETQQRSREMDFGISLDPLAVTQRHALYDSDSDEEEDENQRPREPLGEPNSDGRQQNSDFLTYKTLIIGIGSTASVFVRGFVHLSHVPSLSIPAEAVSTVGKRAKDVHDRRGPHEIAPVEFYGAADGKDECVVSVQPTLQRVEYSNRWTEKVFEQGKPGHVVVYICQSLHEYFSLSPLGDEDTLHVLRELRSSTWPHPLGGMALEPPNSVKGETASILTYCELQGIPCCVQILYASSSLTETEKAMCFLPSLQQIAKILPKSLSIRDEEEGESMVKKIQPKKRTDLATLYT